jgi:hypothetical protein
MSTAGVLDDSRSGIVEAANERGTMFVVLSCMLDYEEETVPSNIKQRAVRKVSDFLISRYSSFDSRSALDEIDMPRTKRKRKSAPEMRYEHAHRATGGPLMEHNLLDDNDQDAENCIPSILYNLAEDVATEEKRQYDSDSGDYDDNDNDDDNDDGSDIADNSDDLNSTEEGEDEGGRSHIDEAVRRVRSRPPVSSAPCFRGESHTLEAMRVDGWTDEENASVLEICLRELLIKRKVLPIVLHRCCALTMSEYGIPEYEGDPDYFDPATAIFSRDYNVCINYCGNMFIVYCLFG